MSTRNIDTGSDDLLARVEDRVAILTMNRPKRRNALSPGMLQGLELALDDAERSKDVGAVVLTGAGGAFCAGGDVKGMAEQNERSAGDAPSADAHSADPKTGGGIDAAIHRQRLMQRNTSGRIYTMPKPVVAALPGAAAGAGLSLALACDLRIATEKAILTTAFARVGFSGDYGGTYFMTQLIGAAKARELYFLSERIDAKQAEHLGLVNQVVAAEALEEKTLELASRLASGPSVAYRYMKENLNRAIGGEVMNCLDLEATHHVHTGRTRDHREAVKAFVDKREPEFEGR